MNTFVKIVKAFPRAIRDPFRAIALFRRRVLPFGLTPKDPEAYRIASWSYGDIPRVPLSKVLPAISSINEIKILNVFNRVEDLSIDVNELSILNSIVKSLDPARILEIGTWDGNTALNLAANIQADGYVVTLDLPPDSKGDLQLNIPHMLNNLTDRTLVGSQFKNTSFEPKIKQKFGDSATINWNELGGPFDLIFIDGCHAFNYVKSDTENSLRVLREGGSLLWHDYGMIKDVSDYLDKISKIIPIQVIKGTRIAASIKLNKEQISKALDNSTSF